MARDGHIRLLPLHVANKIAAGEVVERPASVFKELVENAIDAGATRIDASISAGGRKLVAVRDDGCGMSREDALLSLERQATSKIRDVDDIERIDTLGFRGEAIPSIAAVSRFTLVTRARGADEGTRIVVNAGTVAEAAPCGAPPGTSVEVRDLFCNVPARRKFLRACATEEAHVKSSAILHALAHPDIGFSLSMDGRETFRLAPKATLEERILALFGESFFESLAPVDATHGDVRVHGYVERPDMEIPVRHDQFMFINGRPASAPAVAYAMREGYPKRKTESRPAAILFIDLPPSAVDVNVHPAKREVRFRRPADVRETIVSALESAFTRAVSAPDIPKCQEIPDTPAAPDIPAAPEHKRTLDAIAPFSTPPARPPVLPPPPPRPQAPIQTYMQTGPEPAADAEPSRPGPWKWFKYLATTSSGFLLVETDAGIATLNPRAAMERIAFEHLVDSGAASSQQLLFPAIVHLPPLASARLKMFADTLRGQGFAIEEFGCDVWKVDAVPSMAASLDAASLVSSIATDIGDSGSKRGGERWREELIAKSVARSFAAAQRGLSRDESEKLIGDLASCRMPYVDPRGRPVMIFTSNSEMARKFILR